MLKFHLFGTVCQFSDGGDVALRLDTIGLGDTEIDQEFFPQPFRLLPPARLANVKWQDLCRTKWLQASAIPLLGKHIES